jgi:predicted component of type VI protein secretion system
MPLIEVIRKGITPAVRKVPTSTAAVMMPMTLDRVGKDLATEKEDATEVESVNDAFKKFKPKLDFKGYAGKEETEFKSEFRFNSIKDFDPENLQKRQEIRTTDELGEEHVEVLRNDVADLKDKIDLLYRVKDRWRLPSVRRAWSNPDQRKEIISALGKLREELQKVAKEGSEG